MTWNQCRKDFNTNKAQTCTSKLWLVVFLIFYSVIYVRFYCIFYFRKSLHRHPLLLNLYERSCCWCSCCTLGYKFQHPIHFFGDVCTVFFSLSNFSPLYRLLCWIKMYRCTTDESIAMDQGTNWWTAKFFEKKNAVLAQNCLLYFSSG